MILIKSWSDSLTTGETNDVLKNTSLAIAAQMSSRIVGDRVASLLASNDFRSLCDLEIDYGQLSTSDAIRARQIRAFFEKRKDIEFGISREKVALDTFLESEKLCKQTNLIFDKRSRGEFCFPRDVERTLSYAWQKVCAVLGPVPKLADLRLRFGPGATTSLPKKNAAPRTKLGMPFACSEDLAPYIDAVLEQVPGWIPFTDEDSVRVPVEIHTGKLAFVPKSWKTDRSIVVEPMLNSMVQLGIGDYIADRLSMIGQDTKDQSRNRKLAREGSLSGEYATLDLSSASDTIATGLVYDLLPYEWATSLDVCRTSRIRCPDGSILKLQKFSSMGNGFTFPLETLIFYSLAYGSCKVIGLENPRVEVYGDDIVLPVEAYDLLTKTLRCCGFIPNLAKSYASGPFRESCGADYLRGIDIRPSYVKDALSGASLFTLHNFFRREYEDELADSLLQYLEPTLLIFGPDGYGDGHLLPPFGVDVASFLKPHKRGLGWGGYTFSTFIKGTRSLTKRKLPGDWVLPCYSVYIRHASEPTEDIVPKELPLEYRYKKGLLCNPLPGVKGYKRIEIYTFKLN